MHTKRELSRVEHFHIFNLTIDLKVLEESVASDLIIEIVTGVTLRISRRFIQSVVIFAVTLCSLVGKYHSC
jgi:hypothetical protein